MMKTIELEKEKVHEGNLLLVNVNWPLKSEDIIKGLLIPADRRFPDICLQRDAANALQAALEKIQAEDAIVPVSGYRSMEEQTGIYNSCLKEDGEEFTRKYVALPGHSEHQLGLAIDLGLNQEKIDFIRPEFPYEGICDMFRRIAPDYGFIERYSAGKENITGTAHEPWHFRYIGYPHSRIIADRGYVLEEYMDFIKGYRENCRLSYGRHGAGEFEIYYIPATEKRTLVTFPDNGTCRISGNNIDGFIVTCNKKA